MSESCHTWIIHAIFWRWVQVLIFLASLLNVLKRSHTTKSTLQRILEIWRQTDSVTVFSGSQTDVANFSTLPRLKSVICARIKVGNWWSSRFWGWVELDRIGLTCNFKNLQQCGCGGVWAATHCNTLQHTATHCNTLQHTATHCRAYELIQGWCHKNRTCNKRQRVAWRGGGLGSSTIFKKINELYAPS